MAYINGKEVLFAPVNSGGSGGDAVLQEEKAVEITANGSGEALPDEGYDGVKKFVFNVNVPNEEQYLGEYVDGTIYKTGAIVSYNGNIYICIKDLDEMQDPTNTEYWEMLNEEGEVIPEFDEVEGFNVFVEGLEGEVNIGYSVSEKVALPAGSPARLASVSEKNFTYKNIKHGVSIFGFTGTNSTPAEISTEAEMTALLTSGEIGGVYKYTGATGTFENGALYVLEKANS